MQPNQHGNLPPRPPGPPPVGSQPHEFIQQQGMDDLSYQFDQSVKINPYGPFPFAHQQPMAGPIPHFTSESPGDIRPYQPQPSPFMQNSPFQSPGWSPPMSPVQYPYVRHHSYAEPSAYPPMEYRRPPPVRPRNAAPNRRSWSGPSQAAQQERKAYHPQAPAQRSDWVMWVGNVPPNTSHEELWRFFNSAMPTALPGWRGPASIFLISRSSCAFVNLLSQEDLERAVAFFNGKSLRSWDPRCPRMVCRIRRKDDDLRSGVGGQRGTGMHREWIKQQQTSSTPNTAESSTPVQGATKAEDEVAPQAESSVTPGSLPHHQSSASYASTNSSFLTRHFPVRIFILKSHSTVELDESVKSGLWRTQKHNAPILDQAWRTSPEVFLIFGANRSGEFYGYAKMLEPIDKSKAKYPSNSSKGSRGSMSRPEQIPEEGEGEEDRTRASSDPIRPSYVLSPSQTKIAASSPGELTPSEREAAELESKSNTDPIKIKPQTSVPTRPKTLDVKRKDESYFGPDADASEPLAALTVDITDTSVMAEPKPAIDSTIVDDEADSDSSPPFKIQWVKVAGLPFNKTRHLRNPWNADREVKVSRDGTELEPTVGALLMAEFDKLEPKPSPTSPSDVTPVYASVQTQEGL